MLAQESEDRVEKDIYYLSKKMLDYENHYTPLEKAYVALVWATRKLRHYLLAHSIILVSRLDPIKYLFEKPALMGRLACWLLLLSKFDLKYVTRKSVKGRAIAEFLEDHPVEGDKAVEYLFTNEAILQVEEEIWTMYFDGASNQYGYRIGVLLIAPNNSDIPLAFKLRFKVSNNEAEYEVCITGLEGALELWAKRLDIIGDSNLVVSQANVDWKVKEEKMKIYH